jgi:WD40 repeat protein
VSAPVNCVCLHPNQAELVVGDQSGVIHLWDLKTDHNEQLVRHCLGYISGGMTQIDVAQDNYLLYLPPLLLSVTCTKFPSVTTFCFLHTQAAPAAGSVCAQLVACTKLHFIFFPSKKFTV